MSAALRPQHPASLRHRQPEHALRHRDPGPPFAELERRGFLHYDRQGRSRAVLAQLPYREARIELALNRPVEAHRHPLQEREACDERLRDRLAPAAAVVVRRRQPAREQLGALRLSPLPDFFPGFHDRARGQPRDCPHVTPCTFDLSESDVAWRRQRDERWGRVRAVQAVVEQAPDAMIYADREGAIRIWNNAAKAIFGYAAAEVIGQEPGSDHSRAVSSGTLGGFRKGGGNRQTRLRQPGADDPFGSQGREQAVPGPELRSRQGPNTATSPACWRSAGSGVRGSSAPTVRLDTVASLSPCLQPVQQQPRHQARRRTLPAPRTRVSRLPSSTSARRGPGRSCRRRTAGDPT